MSKSPDNNAATKKIDSLKHKKATRAHIPSKEEAGFESNEPEHAPNCRSIPSPRAAKTPNSTGCTNTARTSRRCRSTSTSARSTAHEHIAPETLIQRLYELKREGCPPGRHVRRTSCSATTRTSTNWTSPPTTTSTPTTGANRLIQGDSLLVMTSLLEREGMAGKVQMIYIDPPYGIKYGSNWQIKLNDRNVKDGDDAA